MTVPAIVQANEETANNTQPQPLIGMLSARISAPIRPVAVPNHLRTVSHSGGRGGTRVGSRAAMDAVLSRAGS